MSKDEALKLMAEMLATLKLHDREDIADGVAWMKRSGIERIMPIYERLLEPAKDATEQILKHLAMIGFREVSIAFSQHLVPKTDENRN